VKHGTLIICPLDAVHLGFIKVSPSVNVEAGGEGKEGRGRKREEEGGRERKRKKRMGRREASVLCIPGVVCAVAVEVSPNTPEK
jgi:hypothetical protein